MATTKKSTTAKTKTSKSRTKKSGGQASKSKNKIVATKSVTNKKISTKEPTKPSKLSQSKTKPASNLRVSSFGLKRVVTLRTLHGLHLLSAGLFLLLALAAGYFMNNTSYQLTLGHLAKDEIASKVSPVLVPAVQSVFDVQVRWIVVVIMLIAIILPALYLTKLTVRYADFLKKTRMLPLRWLDYAVIGALMVETIALISGVSDLPTLKLLAGLVVLSAATGLIAERQNNVALTPVRSSYFLSMAAGLLPLLFILSYAVATIVYGTSQVPWYLYGLYAVVVFYYLLWMRNMRMHLRGADNMIVERNYLSIGLLAKFAFAIILIVGLFR